MDSYAEQCTAHSSLNFPRHPLQLQQGPDFDGSLLCTGDSAGNLNSDIEIRSVNQEVTAELLASFSEGAVSHEPTPFAHPDTGGGLHALQRIGANELAGRVKLVRELGRIVVTLRSLRFGHCLLVHIDKEHVFHDRELRGSAFPFIVVAKIKIAERLGSSAPLLGLCFKITARPAPSSALQTGRRAFRIVMKRKSCSAAW